MVINLKNKIVKKILIATILVLFLLIPVVKKLLYYAADPVGAKDCPPVYPASSDPNKLTNIQVSPEAYSSNLLWEQKGGEINDASCLDKTHIYGLIKVRNEADIKNALIFAKEKGLKISAAGAKHSMGGQAFYKNNLVVDMTGFNQVILNEQAKTITVQSGATWHDIQNYLHPKYAVKAMQSTDIFTVGGSISVNAHGMDHQVGALGKTVRSMRVMMADGTIKKLSRTENPELFRLVIGGYGLLGLIIDTELDITENVVYESGRKVLDYKEFPELFSKEIAPDKRIGLMYMHLSTAPKSLLREMIVYTYKQVEVQNPEIPPLGEVSGIKFRRLIFNLSKQGKIPKALKWWAEKNIEPRIESCSVKSRNQAMSEGEACLVSRNEPMHDSVKYLNNRLKDDTDILHEYFIPRDKFVSFVDGLREIMERNKTNLLNASVRVVHKEDNFLNYAPSDMFSIVLYINQTTDQTGNEQMKKTTQELIDLTTTHGGRFFLPYQLHYSKEQLEKSYPQIKDFFAAKRKYDPNAIFTNTFYEKYAKLF